MTKNAYNNVDSPIWRVECCFFFFLFYHSPWDLTYEIPEIISLFILRDNFWPNDKILKLKVHMLRFHFQADILVN